MKLKLMSGALAGALLLLGAYACNDLLEVQDPQRYTSEDLDDALEAVTNGVEGDLHDLHDNIIMFGALASDELQHTGTWSGWDDQDHGRWLYDFVSPSNTALLRVRWFARDAEERLKRVLGESEAMSYPGMAQVKMVEGWSDLLNAEYFCEAPAVASGPAVSDDQLMAIARDELTAAMSVAQGANQTDYYLISLAGRARANLWLGDYAAALADARAVLSADPDFIYWAEHTVTQGGMYIVWAATYTELNAGGLREKWWPYVDADASLMRDVYTGELDPRLPIYYEPGQKGVDGVTDFYSQIKYPDRDADARITHSGEMKLIEAEVLWRQGDMAGAMQALNFLRTRAGLTAHAPTTDSDQVFEYFMHEMFAELFLEGRRFSYLDRLGQVEEIFGAMNDPELPLPRPTKWPLAEGEARYNPNIEDDAAIRCLPMSGTTF
jgi:hypothetical protein